ncbi:MAG: hypothetical protein WCF94_00615 [bacterium]
MKNTFKSLLLLSIFVFGIGYIYAWTGPTAPAPDKNVAAPLNVGANQQIKVGNLILGENILGNELAKLQVKGNVLIVGTTTIINGSQGAGKVLTSDANGVASWKTPAVQENITPPADLGPDFVYFSNKEIETSGSIPTAQTFCEGIASTNSYKKGYVVAYDDISGKDVFTCWLYGKTVFTSYKVCIDGTTKCVNTPNLNVVINHKRSTGYVTDTYVNQTALANWSSGKLVVGNNNITLKMGINYWNLWGDNGDADPVTCTQGVRDEIIFPDGSKLTTDDWMDTSINGYYTGYLTQSGIKYVWVRSSAWGDCAAVTGGRILKVTGVE